MATKVSETKQVTAVRRLRVELGQTQSDISDRALASGQVREGFKRETVSKADKDGVGLNSYETRLALAVGLGLSVTDLDAYLKGKIDVAEAMKRSSVRPEPEKVRELKRRYFGDEDDVAPLEWPGTADLLQDALTAIRKTDMGLDWALAGYLTTPTAERPPAEGATVGFFLHRAEIFSRVPTTNDERARLDKLARSMREQHAPKSSTKIGIRSRG